MADKYFPDNETRNVYEALSEIYSPEDSNGKEILRTALLRRAIEAVRRIVCIKEDEPALKMLVQHGSVGQDLYDSFKAAEREISADIEDIKEEAEMYEENWGESIIIHAGVLLDKMKKAQAGEQ